MIEKLYTAAEAAAKIGCSISTIHRAAQRIGAGQQPGRERLFAAADLDRLAAAISPGQPGNPQFFTVENPTAKAVAERQKRRKSAQCKGLRRSKKD